MSAGAIMLIGVVLYGAAIAGALVAAARGSGTAMWSGLAGSIAVWLGLTGLAFELSGAHGTAYYYLDLAALATLPVALAGTLVATLVARRLLRGHEARAAATPDLEA